MHAAILPRPATVSRILEVLRERTGLDFSGYRAQTMARRIANRMIAAGSVSGEDYLERLQRNRDEPRLLVERLTIKVSRFYRNAPAFDLLRDRLLPVLARVAAPRPLRLWSAGCGQGEEAYTLAMLLEERGTPGTVLATDIDPGALAAAHAAVYGGEALRELPAALRERFLQPGEGLQPRWRVRESVRRRVSFALHDLQQELPTAFHGFDVIACRNVVIYLQREQHAAVLSRLHSALVSGGCLLMGEAERPPAAMERVLLPLDWRERLFLARHEGTPA